MKVAVSRSLIQRIDNSEVSQAYTQPTVCVPLGPISRATGDASSMKWVTISFTFNLLVRCLVTTWFSGIEGSPSSVDERNSRARDRLGLNALDHELWEALLSSLGKMTVTKFAPNPHVQSPTCARL